MLRCFAPAKVNLALHVTGQRSDGYHLLDSLVVFASIGDWVTLGRGPAGFTLSGPQAGALAQSAAAGQNSVLRMLAAFDMPDLAVHLEKHLPVAAGIGGGSSDGAATYRGILALKGRAPAPGDADQLLALGADVPVCALAQPCLMQGIGAILTPVPELAPLHAVLVNPGVPVATAQVFAALACKANSPLPALPKGMDQPTILLEWLQHQRNDLQAPALAIAPSIADVLAALHLAGAQLARMSGSGATCFGIYPSAQTAAKAAETLRADNPQWWVQPCQLTRGVDTTPQAMRATT